MISTCLLALALTAAGPDASPGPDRDAYRTAAAAAGRDADAHVDLALWCEARGMAPEKTRHLARAVLLDPENARARGLLGQVKREGRWMRPADAVRAVEDSPEQQALMREYFERRAQTRDKADDQYKLALWCEEKGLEEPMTAHLRRTLQLDPGREGAWRRLGFKKVGKRWVNPDVEAARQAARDARERADKEWTPRLSKLREALSSRDRAKRDDARATLAEIHDPAAAASVWKVFVKGGGESGRRVAVDVLSRIDGPDASIALATLSVFSPDATLRSDAAALLSRRDPRDFARYLAGLIRKETRYQVKDVEGPGSPGSLTIQGEGANVVRRYSPMAPLVAPGTAVSPDFVLTKPLSVWNSGWDMSKGGRSMAELAANRQAAWDQATERMQAGLKGTPGASSVIDRVMSAGPREPFVTDLARLKDPSSRAFQEAPVSETDLQVPIGRMVAETRMSAMAARARLEADVRALERQTASIRETNDRVASVLKTASGRDFGDDPDKWTGWAVDLEGYAFTASPDYEPPTYVQEVPIGFQPQAAPSLVNTRIGTAIVAHACFAAGTMVRTLQGDRPIESIEAGDQVLSQDLTTGDFRYRAVATAFHNPPNQTLRVRLGDDEVVATGIHRFWVADRGWTMARELKPGDRLRTVGGSAMVTAVESDRVQPVFNLQLIDGDSFCVGGLGVVAHDNSLVEPVAAPFDAVPELAAADTP